MAQAQESVEQPATESPDVDALLDAKFGTGEQETEQPQPREPEAQEGDEAQATTETEQQAEPELVEIEVDGEKWQVPPKLKDRFMAQKDYTEKSTETARLKDTLSLQQKEVALFQEQRAFEQSVAEDVDRLKMLDQYITYQKANTDWAKLTTDQVVRAKLEIDQHVEQRNELAKALEGKRNEFKAKLNGELSKLAQSADELLRKSIPNYSPETRAELEKYVVGRGIPEHVAKQMSPVVAEIVWESQQYRKLKAETKNAVKKAADAPVIAPTARKNPMPQRVRAQLDLKNAVKAGKRENVAAALDKRLEQMFGG